MVEKFIVLDTETTNDIECPLTYDIGFAVIDKFGTVYEQNGQLYFKLNLQIRFL